jgi:hypothetical protein
MLMDAFDTTCRRFLLIITIISDSECLPREQPDINHHTVAKNTVLLVTILRRSPPILLLTPTKTCAKREETCKKEIMMRAQSMTGQPHLRRQKFCLPARLAHCLPWACQNRPAHNPQQLSLQHSSWRHTRKEQDMKRTTLLSTFSVTVETVMNPHRQWSSGRRCLRGALLALLLLAPVLAQAQSENTQYGSGALFSDTTGFWDAAFGFNALYNNTTGSYDTGIGANSLYSNTTGIRNTATGAFSLHSNTTGSYNAGDGVFSLYLNTTGSYNAAHGYAALNSNSVGNYNTGTGFEALYSNTSGSFNSAHGLEALYYNTTGNNNTAEGVEALFNNTTGTDNSASGFEALWSNATGGSNSAQGFEAMYYSTAGYSNTANGYQALFQNSNGSYNTGIGAGALWDNNGGYFNTGLGYNALYNHGIGNNNTALGSQAGQNIVNGSNNIDIGNFGVNLDNGVIRIGTRGAHTAAYIAGISGVTTSGGVAVYINSNGQLGTLTSSRRFKNHIQDMGSLSEKLLQLRPVTFRYNDAAETGPHHRQYGLIAEEVARVCPDLVQYDRAGKPFTVYYHLLTPMLLNEVQKAHRQIAALKSAQTAEVAALKADLRRQGAELASLKQDQQQQNQTLARLAATIQTARNGATTETASFYAPRSHP